MTRASTRAIWDEQNRHPGDHARLFSTLGANFEIGNVLYPGSWADISASFVFDHVIYVDSDARAARFFADRSGVDELIAAHHPAAKWRFLHADYTTDLDVPAAFFDLLISLSAGFVSEHCSHHLRPGGVLLVNPSHGDAAMASIDDRFELAGVLNRRSGKYTFNATALDTYLVPKKATSVTKKLLHGSGRGIAYTRSPSAYVFRKHT